VNTTEARTHFRTINYVLLYHVPDNRGDLLTWDIHVLGSRFLGKNNNENKS
jgi:hypothetical protein